MKLHLVCGSDDLVMAQQCVQVTKATCVATDGFCLVVYDTKLIFSESFIDKIPDSGVLIHKDDWKIIVSNGAVSQWKDDTDIIKVFRGNKRPYLIETEDFRYPDWSKVIPDISESAPAEFVCVDPKKLYNMSQALGATLKLIPGKSSTTAFYAHPQSLISGSYRDDNDLKGCYGIIMPLRCL